MRKIFSLLCALALFVGCTSSSDNGLAKPSAKQLRFADWEVGAFFHYDLNAFTGQEHGDGQEPPSKFNPTELDVEQWIKAAKAMGAKYACLTARHEGGFCLWPSKTTDYTIANSPYKDGKGDIVREFVDACRKYDIVPAFYHTAGFDANATLGKYDGDLPLPLEWSTTWGQAMAEAFKKDSTLHDRYVNIQKEQMRELLTNYGPIGFMWSDHWDASDPDGAWRAVTDLAAELQPDMVFMGPETWVPGNETGHVVYPMWNGVNTADGTNYSRAVSSTASEKTENSYGLLETDALTGHPLGKFWRVRECTTNGGFHYGGWFWHPRTEVRPMDRVRPRGLSDHIDLYYRTVGLGANTIINLPIDDRGLVPYDIVAAAEAFGAEIKKRFSTPIAELGKVVKGDEIVLEWSEPTEINTIVTMENIAGGQKIAKYNYQAYIDGAWVDLAPKNKHLSIAPYNPTPGYETIGHKKIDVIEPVTTNKIRFQCLESVVPEAEIRNILVYNCSDDLYKSKFPYLSGMNSLWEDSYNGMQRDQNFDGKRATIDGVEFEHSLLMWPVASNAPAHVEYNLRDVQDKGVAFKAVVGIDDSRGDKGSSEFIVKGFKDGKWEPIYNSGVLKGSSPKKEIYLEIDKSYLELRLENSYGGDNVDDDHCVWGDAQLVCLLK